MPIKCSALWMRGPVVAAARTCSADTCKHTPATMVDTPTIANKRLTSPHKAEQSFTLTMSAATIDNSNTTAQKCLLRNKNVANHSSERLDEIYEVIDLDRCRKPNKDKYECQIEYERRCSLTIENTSRCETHKKDIYGNESIIRERVEVDVYGGIRRAADLKFKCVRDAQERMEAFGRTMGARVRIIAVMGLLLAMLTTCAAAPPRSRPARSAHHESAVSQ